MSNSSAASAWVFTSPERTFWAACLLSAKVVCGLLQPNYSLNCSNSFFMFVSSGWNFADASMACFELPKALI